MHLDLVANAACSGFAETPQRQGGCLERPHSPHPAHIHTNQHIHSDSNARSENRLSFTGDTPIISHARRASSARFISPAITASFNARLASSSV